MKSSATSNKADVLGAAQAPEGALPLGRRAADAGRVLCLIGAALGAVGLLGWITGFVFVTTLIPGAPQMKANTAVSLLLMGVAAALRRYEVAPRALRVLTGVAAVAVFAIGFGTVVEYASGIDLGIDQLLFRSGPERYPGRPSPPTALALALLATALLLFDTRPRARARPSEWLIMAAGLVGFVAIIGAAFGAGPLYRMRSAPITGVAVPTAIGLLLVSAGMALERPAGGIAGLTTSPGPGGVLLRRLVVPAIVVPPLLAFGLSRLFDLVGIKDFALLFATLIALTTVVGLALLATSAGPLERTHRALEASRSATRELVQQAPDGIFVADLEGRYTDVNPAGCDMLGFSREELVGKTIVDLIPAEDVGRLAVSKQLLLGGGSDVSEWSLRRKDGTYVPVELNAKILPDGRWQAFVRDTTERKRAEDALRASEIESARLYRLAQTAIEARDDILGVVAHDLRNPLGGIAMQAQMLLRKTAEGDTTTVKAAEGIRRAVARMNRLIQDLLDVTRIESGHLSIEPRRESTAQVVSEALEAQKPLSAAAAIELRWDLSPALPDVMADRDRLIQVFENLVGNAIKFAPSGSQVIVGAETRGADVVFWVADNGPGIPIDAVAHLFDRFWQVKRADRRGAGLGLPIVKGIIEAHGGRVWVDSAPGRGTTFFFTIPAASVSNDRETALAHHGP